MAQIEINFGNVNDVNSRMPRYRLKISEVKRELEILKWKLDKDIMKQEGLENQYESVLKELRRAEEDMERIKQHVSGGVESYRQSERELVHKQSKIKNRFI